MADYEVTAFEAYLDLYVLTGRGMSDRYVEVDGRVPDRHQQTTWF